MGERGGPRILGTESASGPAREAQVLRTADP